MTQAANTASRFALLALAGFGTLAGGRLSVDHLRHGEICPMLGPIPACIIVFLGYLFIVLSAAFLKRTAAKKLFYIGWTPVFLLALMGVILELTKGKVCPPGTFGVPQCFFSLAMALLCLGLFKFSSKTASTT